MPCSCRGFWLKQENVEQELRLWMEKQGCSDGLMPTQAALRRSGAVMLASAVSSFGAHNLAEALG